jgi:hypothetical protein
VGFEAEAELALASVIAGALDGPGAQGGGEPVGKVLLDEQTVHRVAQVIVRRVSRRIAPGPRRSINRATVTSATVMLAPASNFP